jgi:hypothetical protein
MDSTGGVKATNTFGAGGLVSRKTSATSTFYLWDERGTCTQRRNASGAILSNHATDAWGNQHNGLETVVSTGDPYSGFSGKDGIILTQKRA